MNCLYYIVKLSDEDKLVAGPFKESAVIDQLKGGLVAWTDISWSPHQKEPWRRLYEFKEFHSILPKLPSAAVLEQLTQACKSDGAEAASPGESILKPPFYLQVLGSEQGPFSLIEVRDLLQRAKFDDQVYLWCKGLQFWLPIQEVPEFAHLKFANSTMTRTRDDVFGKAARGHEGRGSNREGFVCTVRLRRNPADRPVYGVCLDGSATGVQVRLENHVPFQKGEEYTLELLPLSLLKLPTLQCKARIAWYKQDSLTLGVQFVAFERDGAEKLKNHFNK